MSYLNQISNAGSQNETGTAVHLKDVTLSLNNTAGEVKILRGLSFDIEKGEAVGIIGPSGGGKSTMIMVVAGLERISSGIIKTAGIDLTSLDEDELARFRRDNIGIVFQDFHLIPTMTAHENVAVPLEFSGNINASDLAREQLNAVGLDHRLTHYPSQLSGGEQQRVALARAFAVRPKILLADEPTGNLDGITGKAVMDLLFKLQATTSTTLILVSHDPMLADRCDRIITLADGRVIESK
ncbi:MAG TPA: ABC transporter ATP-binding protein [Rhodospirillales bacterium]|nr:ABC transporter ATP-binding protein [Rhodospirillales bacterium]